MMKKNKILVSTLFLFISVVTYGQLDANALVGLPNATTAEMNAIITPNIGSVLFNTTEQAIYRFTSTGWQRDADDQTALEVNLDTAVDANGDTTNETTVEAVVQAITPITSGAGRVFYPPSIAINASTLGTGRTINLYTEYTNQFAPAGGITTRSTSAASTIPVYAANELDFYVTYFDPAVFNITNISDAGVMTYDIIGVPADYNSLINVVFVIR